MGTPLFINEVRIEICYEFPFVPPGAVAKLYDVIYVDGNDFSDNYSNRWSLLGSVMDDHLVDTGQVSGIHPRDLGKDGNPEMRFYRVSPTGKWIFNNGRRLASEEIYVMKPIHLYPGENWVSFPGWPDEETPYYIFGHGLPGGLMGSNSTRITWFNRTTNTMVTSTNTIYLENFGGVTNWRHEIPALPFVADYMPIPFHQGCVVEIPTGSPPQTILFIGRVPTNAAPRRDGSRGSPMVRFITR